MKRIRAFGDAGGGCGGTRNGGEKKFLLAAGDKNHIVQDIRAISVVRIFMNDHSGCCLYCEYASIHPTADGLGRGQKACFTKQEIRADERPVQRERRVAGEWKMSQKTGNHRGG